MSAKSTVVLLLTLALKELETEINDQFISLNEAKGKKSFVKGNRIQRQRMINEISFQ